MKGISVIIPSYNSSKTVRQCVLSVIETAYPNLEIIVVDDFSNDGSPQIVEKLSQENPGIVRLIRMRKNGGPAKARNIGAGYATKEYLFFLDSDTVMLSDAIYNFTLSIEKADAVTGIYHFEPLNKGVVQKYKALFNYYFFSRKGIIEYEVFDASRAGVKAEIFRDIGGFNENLRWGMDYENEEFGYRFTRKYKNLLDPSIMVKHVFPGFKKLTKTYFFRVSFWVEIFFHRRKFESGGVTSAETGISTASLLLAVMVLPFSLVHPSFYFIFLFFLFLYLYGYMGFLMFVFRKKGLFFILAILVNIYFSFIIGAAFLWGLMRVILKKSDILDKSKKEAFLII